MNSTSTSAIPEYMQNAGVNSGFGLLLITLVFGSSYVLTYYSEPSLVIPRLIKHDVDKGTDFLKSKNTAISKFVAILVFPIISIIPLTIFLTWTTSDGYEGCSVFFMTLFWFFAALSYTNLRSTLWHPFPIFYMYSNCCGFCFFLFVATQLFGMKKTFNYSVAGTMWVGISAIPIIAFCLLVEDLAQDNYICNHNIDAKSSLIYQVNLKPCIVVEGFMSYIESFINILKNLTPWKLNATIYFLSLLPIIIFMISSIVSQKTGVAIVAFVVMVFVEFSIASLYTDSICLGNINKLGLTCLALRFTLFTSGIKYWLVVQFTVLSFTSVIVSTRVMEYIAPDPEDKRKFAKQLLHIFENSASRKSLDTNFWDEPVSSDDIYLDIEDEGSTSKSIRFVKHRNLDPPGLSHSTISLMTLQCLSAFILILASSQLTGLQISKIHGASQSSLCALIWLISVITILVLSTIHFTKRIKQGADFRSRSNLLCTIKNMLDNIDGFDRFEQDLESISLFFIPDIKGNHIIGLLILFIWLLSIAASIVASWIFNMWFLVPCTALMPLSNLILYKFFSYWGKNDCEVSLFYETFSQHAQETDIHVDESTISQQEKQLKPMSISEQTVVSTQMFGKFKIGFTGDWTGEILNVRKISSNILSKGLLVNGISSSTFIGSWTDDTLTVISVLTGALGIGHVIRGKGIPDNISIVEVVDEKRGIYTLSADIPPFNSKTVSMMSIGSSILEGTAILDFGTGKGGKGTYKLSHEHSMCEMNVNMYAFLDCKFIGEISGNILTVDAIESGSLTVGQEISGEGVIVGTIITEFLTGQGGVGTYSVEAPAKPETFVISFKCLKPLKRFVIRNWVLACILDIVAMFLSIPSRHNEVPFLIFLFKTSLYLSYASLIRWRSKMSFDKYQILWILSSWLPLVFWAGFGDLFHLDSFVIILFFFGAIATQLFLLSILMVRDTNQTIGIEECVTTQTRIVKILTFTSFCFLIIIFAALIGIYSAAAGACLIIISIIPIFFSLIHFGIIPVVLTKRRLKYLLIAFCITSILCGMTGALMHPSYAFYWASFAWGALGLLAFGIGLHFDTTGPECVYGAYFFPVYKLSDDGRRIIDVSIQAGGIVISLVMLCIWSLWCAVCEGPDPIIAVFVITWLALISYTLLKARNFDEFSKLIGFDRLKLDRSCSEAIKFHIHELHPTVWESLHRGPHLHSAEGSNVSYRIVVDEEDVADYKYNPFESIRTILAIRDQKFTSFVGRLKVFPFDSRNIEDNNSLLSDFDELIKLINTLDRMFCTYRLKALKDASCERRLVEAEIVNYIRINVPNKTRFTINDLEKIPDFQMVEIMTKFKSWKDNREIIQRKAFEEARRESEEAEKKRKEERRYVLVQNIMAARQREARGRLVIDAARREADLRRKKREADDILRRQQQEEVLWKKEEEERQKAFQLAFSKALERDQKKVVLQNNFARAKERCSKYVCTLSTKAGSQQCIARGKIQEKIQNILSSLSLSMDNLARADNDSMVETIANDIDQDVSQLLLFQGELEAFDSSIVASFGDIHTIDNDENIVVTSFGVSTSMTLEEYVASLKLNNGRFKDPDFDPGMECKRIIETDRDLATKIDGQCLPSNPSPDDVKQGQLGDCYYLSAIATMAERPDLIRKLFAVRDFEKSIFAIKLYFNGAFRTVVVDDFFPYQRGRYLYAHGKEGDNSRSLWVMLLEKAYAKLHGSFKAIEGGYESEAMADLTGGIPDIITPIDKDMDTLWIKLKSLNENKHLIGAGSIQGKDTDSTSEGIIKSHAYSILDVRQVDEHRLLKLRNPWGRGEWKGRWSDGSVEWTPRYKKLLNHQDVDDGTFWIAFEDFCHNYHTVYSCQVFSDMEKSSLRGSWSSTSSGGCLKDRDTFSRNPHFALKGSGSVTVVLEQIDITATGDDITDLKVEDVVPVGIYALDNRGSRCAKGTLPNFQEIVDKTSFQYLKYVTLELELQPDRVLTVVPCTYDHGIYRQFIISAYSKTRVELIVIE